MTKGRGRSKYRQWRFSKYEYPTYVADGGTGNVRNVLGRNEALRELMSIVGSDRARAMIQTDTIGEWVFKEPV